MTVSTANVRGVDLSYEIGGDGPTLVWGHGLTSSMAREDLFQMVDLRRVRTVARVVRYDARGHGLSGSTADPQGYHWRELALDQFALLDELGIQRYIAAGASMGCATALHAAVLAPDRVTALILAIPPTAWETRVAQQQAYETSAQLVEAGEVDVLIAGAAASPLPDPLAPFAAEWRAGSEASFRSSDPIRLARVFRGAAVADLPDPEQLTKLSVPTLVMAWTGDPGHPMSTANRLIELIPHADLVAASTLDELLRWTDATIDFIQSL